MGGTLLNSSMLDQGERRQLIQKHFILVIISKKTYFVEIDLS